MKNSKYEYLVGVIAGNCEYDNIDYTMQTEVRDRKFETIFHVGDVTVVVSKKCEDIS